MGEILLTRLEDDVRKKIDGLLVRASEVLDLPRQTDSQIAAFRVAYLDWDEFAATTLKTSFKTTGALTSGPTDDFRAVGISLLDLRFTSTHLPPERVGEVERDVREKCRVLASVRQRLSLYETLPGKGDEGPAIGPSGTSSSIFLVHGHNLLLREQVRRYIVKITDRDVLVLDEQPNQGRDVLGKLLDHAVTAAFAVVLLTGDDEGRAAGAGSWSPRARQNVVLELGLFLGLLGRNKVVALYEAEVEIPSDYSGVLWVPLRDQGWQMQLAREMQAAGIAVDVNQAL